MHCSLQISALAVLFTMWPPHLRSSGSEFGLDMGYLLGNLLGICFYEPLGAPIGDTYGAVDDKQVGSSLIISLE